ncbi:MAG: NADPH:quinone oxidoreductase family protein [Alphaproteobacteria bacterium]|nr:NADPH:quinone oxidoreductase family protein [Alphaproteobacteria bacterium]
MKAHFVEAFGPPEAIAFRDIPASELPKGHVRLRVRASGASLLDALIAAGKYQVKPPLPFSPGSEFAGEVEAVAADVTTLKVGERVMAGGFTGGFSQTAVVPAVAAVPIPDAMSFETAAGFRTNYMTALHAFRQRADLKAGETLLVLGAGGGVGSAGIEVAKIMGARVIAAASSDEKRAFATKLGADHAIDIAPEVFRDRIKEITGGRGVDVVYDPVGGQLTELAFRSLAWRGRHLVVGFAAGTIPALPVNLALLKGAALVGVDLARFSFMHEPAVAAENLKQLLAWFASGQLKPQVGRVYAFSEARQALSDILNRRAVGKAVVRVD